MTRRSKKSESCLKTDLPGHNIPYNWKGEVIKLNSRGKGELLNRKLKI